jgi:ubiquinone/menaquinone biosynthesis C-methylase UbiE
MESNEIEKKVIDGFGDEWSRYHQQDITGKERERLAEKYFRIFPFDKLPKDGGEGADIGCGSGRYGRYFSPNVRKLHLVDASEKALAVAKENCKFCDNVVFQHGNAYELSFDTGQLDFAYSLGVFHHMRDSHLAVTEITRIVKPGGPVLLYLYYALDNRPFLYRLIWKISGLFRQIISRLNYPLRNFISTCIAITVYWPLARAAKVLDWLGILPKSWPLKMFRDSPLYHMRTGSLDRFGTRIENRFSKQEIEEMMIKAGLRNIVFSDKEPYWCAVGYKK